MSGIPPEQLLAALQTTAAQVAHEVAGLRSDMTTQLEGLRSEVHGLASRLAPVEEALAQQTREADLAAARAEGREEGAREVARRFGFEEPPTTTVTGVDAPTPRPPWWAASAGAGLELVGTRGGLAVLGAVVTMWLGPDVAASITDLAAALTVTEVAVDVGPVSEHPPAPPYPTPYLPAPAPPALPAADPNMTMKP